MSVPSKPDRSLLDRLNALKPSSISLGDAPSTDITPSALPSAAAPVTREDRLSARLKTLREARDGDADKGGDGHHNGEEGGSEPEKPVASVSPEQAKDDSEVATSEIKSPGANSGKSDDVTDDVTDDPLFYVDDEAVNDLLLELAAEGLGEDEELLDGEDEADRLARGDGTGDDDDLIPLPSVPKRLGDESSDDEDNDADNSKVVEDLLKSLAGTTIKNDTEGNSKKDKQKDGHDSDDSDGDDMQREVRRVLEEARDEADLAKQRGETNDEVEDEHIVTSPRRRSTGLDDEPIPPRDEPKKDDNGADNFLGLPTVPTRLVDPPPSPPSLPSVPSQNLPKRGDDDDISARLAALRGLQGKAAGLGQTDAFGLPSAPTFRPGEEEGGVLKRGHFGHGRNNYTDADQKAWCVVCLEDAAVRCLGCADNNGGDEDDQNNAYCDRCWRDMHVGPAAGFDERGHKRVPLVR